MIGRAACAAFLIAAALAEASPRRVVVIKLDGVPADLVEQLRQERDPRTGNSKLPWIDQVFARQGTRIANFYVRGISLSVPSWSLLDTGQHQRIHGNVEWDRFTLRTYDYLNFFPFYLANAVHKRADMPGVELLDALGTPLVIDLFEVNERYQSFQLFQRWVRWRTFSLGLRQRLFKSPHDLFDEWQIGFDLQNSVFEQQEQELIEHLKDNRVSYLDLFCGDFDHAAHRGNDRSEQTRALQRIDSVIGRIWTAIQASDLRESTVFAVVSDHGINSVEGTYSQGYSLLDWLGSYEGGAHHAITNRYPLDEYKVRGLNPFVSQVVTESHDSSYLKDGAHQYPTAVLDLDGNERAAISLRNSDLNALHILLQQVRKQPGAIDRFFELLAAKREPWRKTLLEMREELAAVHRAIQRERAVLASAAVPEQEARRRLSRILTWEQDEAGYGEYMRVMTNLLALSRERFDASHVRIEDLIPRHSLGEPNSIYDLQNYVAGPAGEGFRHIDYLGAMRAIVVRNNVQKNVGAEPVDFIAVRVPAAAISNLECDDAIWLYGGERSQALILVRAGELRYLPIESLTAEADGDVNFRRAEWRDGFPLALWEDPELQVPGTERAVWLNGWHSEREWLCAVHRTRYSNGIIGISEQFVRPQPTPVRFNGAVSDADERLLLRFEARRRRLVEPDLLVFASDHWNFNVRGFNPGGNHGSFLRISTHSLLMFAGGTETGIPRGSVVEEPYDSLSFAPTLLKLARRGEDDLPGPVIREVLAGR